MKRTHTATAIAMIAGLASLGSMTGIIPASASDGTCGWYAFAGAYPSASQAERAARRIGAQAFDLAYSDSPNRNSGLHAVGVGPGDKAWARQQARILKQRGASDSYIADRCMD